jgi:uncharacterized lipoprotein YddW (UPF0748 family)
MKRLFVLVLVFLLAVGAIVVQHDRGILPSLPSSDTADSADDTDDDTAQMRTAIWVATAYSIDYPSQPTTDAQALKEQCTAILDEAQADGIDTVYLQVRPACDALYPSDLFPWSRYLTGSCGDAPADDFDPLRYWVRQAHKRGMRLEAWINPYRICAGSQADADWDALPDSSPAKQYADAVVRCEGGYYFDPGSAKVRELIADGVREIVENYRVDGIQFDDYFYPSTDFDDADTYAAYTGDLSLDDWRRDNVNQLIQTVSDVVHSSAKNKNCVFGVSPSGIWKNGSGGTDGSETRGFAHYSECYADSITWIQNGWVDYLCPQIYWEIGNDAADFETLVNWWAEQVRGTNTALWIGLAGYKVGDAEAGSVWESDGAAEIGRQLRLCGNTDGVTGVALFSFQNLHGNRALTEEWNTYFSS